MKQKIILSALFVLLMTFAFAQNNKQNDNSQTQYSNSYSFMNKLLKRNIDDQLMPNIQYKLNDKSSNINKQRLDSIIAFYQDDETEKTLFTYDIKGNIIRDVDFYQDNISSQWILKFKTDYTYDENNNIVLFISYRRDTILNQWVNSHKHEFTYNNLEQEIKELLYEWDLNINEWILNFKSERIYNNQGYELSVTGFGWVESASEWENCCKQENSYDEEGNLEWKYSFNWDQDLSLWINRSRREYTYGENQELLIYIYYSWVSDLWLEGQKTEYIYDENGQLFQIMQYGWDSEEQWLNDSKTTSIFDEAGNTIQMMEYEWNEGDSVWMNDYEYDIYYDLSYLMTEVLWPFEDDEMINAVNMPVEMNGYFWSSDIGDWANEFQGNFYYSNYEYELLNEKETIKAQLYPNPVDKQFSIHFSDAYQKIEIQLYDIQGRIVLQKYIKNGENINIEHLETGIYVYSLNIEGKTQRGKLIKR